MSDFIDQLEAWGDVDIQVGNVCRGDAFHDAASRIKALEATLRVGEVFLDKCNSAWSCGEPTHKVKIMLDAADNFRNALNELDK